jgi:CHAT domain-containing protein
MTYTKNELKDLVFELELKEAIEKLLEITGGQESLKFVRANLRQVESHRALSLLGTEAYSVRLAELKHSLLTIIDNLTEAEMNRIKGELFSNSSNIKTLLFIASSPRDYDGLQVGFEYESIKNEWLASDMRDQFKIESPIMSADINTMIANVNSHNPAIVHFSGHGELKGLVMNDRNNNAQLIPTNILESFFGTFSKKPECVFLNSCYSNKQAQTISKHAKYIIGMNQPIGDDSAVKFSKYFYKFLFSTKQTDYEKSFQQAKISLRHETKQRWKPEIWIKGSKFSESS